MPVYEYLCASRHVTEEYHPFAESGLPARCHCGLVAERAILTPPRVFRDLEGYESPATGRWIEGRRARLEDLRRSGCRPYEEGERQQAIARREQAERKLDQEVDAAVDRTLADLTL